MRNKKILSMLAYVVVLLVAGSLVLGFLSSAKGFNWGAEVKVWCDRVALYLSIIVTVACAFFFAGSKRNNAYTIVLVVAVLVIVVFMFIV